MRRMRLEKCLNNVPLSAIPAAIFILFRTFARVPRIPSPKLTAQVYPESIHLSELSEPDKWSPYLLSRLTRPFVSRHTYYPRVYFVPEEDEDDRCDDWL